MPAFRLSAFVVAAALLFASGPSGSVLADEAKGVSVGDEAPRFEVKDDRGEVWKSDEHFGKKVVVVYFYPADMTGGCTAQACAFRDDMGQLADNDVEVVGVSGDTVESHQLFKKAHGLNFTLLADVEGKVADAFGVPKTVGEKTVNAVIDGTTYPLTRNVTTRRWTFIVDRDGQVAYKDDQVKAGQDSKNVIAAIAKLK